MKKITFGLLVAVAAILAGCVVTSVCPFYTEKDLVFEPALVGDWIKEGKNAGDYEVWKFEKSAALAYRFTLIEADKATVMEAHAFKLQGQLFLDIASIDQDIHVIPPHYLLKVSQVTPALRMSELNHDWLKGLLGKEPNAIPHHLVRSGDKPDDCRVVLTASTAELQEFVLKHLKTEAAWETSVELQPTLSNSPSR
jgi:hypothetical protein